MNVLRRWTRRGLRLKEEVHVLYLALRDPRTPWPARLVALLVVAYVFSPVDLIPDFIPVVGYLDDMVLVPLGVALAFRIIPPAVIAEARLRAGGRPALPGRRWWLIPVIIVASVWLIAAGLLLVLALRLLAGPQS